MSVFWDILILFLGFENERFWEKDKRQMYIVIIKTISFHFRQLKINSIYIQYVNMWGGDKYIMFYKVKFSSTSDHWVGLEKKYKSLLQWASWCPSSNVAVIFLIKQTNISCIESQYSSEQSKLACSFLLYLKVRKLPKMTSATSKRLSDNILKNFYPCQWLGYFELDWCAGLWWFEEK